MIMNISSLLFHVCERSAQVRDLPFVDWKLASSCVFNTSDAEKTMKDPSLEHQLLLATIDDRDEGVDLCDSAPDKIVAISPNRRQLIPGRQSRFAATRHVITADVCETIPEESAGGSSSIDNEVARLRQEIVASHPPPRRHRKLLPIAHLSLNIRQVSVWLDYIYRSRSTILPSITCTLISLMI